MVGWLTYDSRERGPRGWQTEGRRGTPRGTEATRSTTACGVAGPRLGAPPIWAYPRGRSAGGRGPGGPPGQGAPRSRGRGGPTRGVFCQVKLSKNRTRIRAEFAPDLGVCRPNPVPPVLVARPRREGRQSDGPGGSPSGRGTASHQTNPSASGPSRRTSPTHGSTVPSRGSPSHLAESMASSDT